MSVLADDFAAASDDIAATAAEYVDGQPGLLDLTTQDVAANKPLYKEAPEQASRPRVETAGSGVLLVQSKRLDAAHPFARLEEFLTGRPYDDVVADPRHDGLVAPSAEEIDGCIVLSMTDTLRDALASLDASALPEVARRWADAEFDGNGEDGLATLLAALTDLARQAGGRGERLYCRYVF